ncbi:AAA family ATPase [Actinoplanes sp. NEAU-A12]|uniref:AAA family ATPase n=1 Tax=Actinoplanes sandaracinus TaxID=3045177 RepID=A0ABT6WRQ4_9ACTN|nr:AAA family ATPase [Actinoplanes sandaracinus]MDI6102417.1 AAA family ATPase [Actinoplanes sandaracinus]
MAQRLILINGLPGSGKSTLAGRLAPTLRVPLIGKDALKEAMAGAVPGVPPKALGRAAAQVMWELAAATPGTVVLESWWFRPRDLAFVTEGVARSGARTTVEIWCAVPPEVALDRYRARRRAALHQDDERVRDDWPRWMAEAEPLGIGPTIVVDTDRPVMATRLIEAISAAIGGV